MANSKHEPNRQKKGCSEPDNTAAAAGNEAWSR